MSDLLKNLDKPVTPEMTIQGLLLFGIVVAIFGVMIIWNDYMEDRRASKESR